MSQDVTDLLLQWNDDNKNTLDQLLDLLASELRDLAAAYLRGERSGHTLQPTALVNELYLRLIDRQRVSWRNRAHFFAFAATTMRRILVDHARQRRAQKRGGDTPMITLTEGDGLATFQRSVDLLDLDAALTDLSEEDPRLIQVIELRFFAGLTIAETAEVLDVGTATVNRDLRAAKAFFMHRFKNRPEESPGDTG